MHYRQDEDFDRRIAMIGFDNAIEFAIATYLTLKPIHRGGKSYEGNKVTTWLARYETRIDFFFEECQNRSVVVVAQKEEVIWVHNLRNEQYHGGGPSYPGKKDLDAARAFALQVFSVLFNEPDIEGLLTSHQSGTSALPPRTDDDDRAIDDSHGLVDLCGRKEYSSDVLYAYDPVRYRSVALSLRTASTQEETT